MLIEKHGEPTPFRPTARTATPTPSSCGARTDAADAVAFAVRNSKRYPPLFRFVVESALQDQTDPLKERLLGVQVFGREPDYDTNLDPIVRYTAGEVRKRIAQYYHLPSSG